MLSPVRLVCSLRKSRASGVLAVLFLCFGCAQVAGFDDFKAPTAGASGGANLNTVVGGAGYQLGTTASDLNGGTSSTSLVLGGASAAGGANSSGGSQPADGSTGGAASGGAGTGGAASGGAGTGGGASGGAGTGGAATGGASAICGGLNQQCCEGETCTAQGTACNSMTKICDACGATNQRCCDAEQRCSNGCCASGRCVAVNQSCGGLGNQCQSPNHCANCGRDGLPCCGQIAAAGSCEYGFTCTAGTCQ